MNELPLISVIIPVYQAELFIERTISSIEKQTYGNFEIICVDDGSTDKSYEKCDELKNTYENIKVYRNQKNMGVEYTRNYGIAKAAGSYFTFVDADDTVEPEMIRDLYLSAASSNADIVLSGYKAVYSDKNEIHLASIESGKYATDIFASFLLDEYPLDVFCCIGGRLYKTELINKYNIRFDVKYKYNEDLAFITSVLRHSKTVSYVSKCYYNYLIRYSGSTMSSKRENMFVSMIRVQEHFKELLQHYNVFERKKLMYYHNVYVLFVSSMYNEIEYGTIHSFVALLSKIRSYPEYNEVFISIRNNQSIAKKHKLINKLIKLRFDILLFLLFRCRKTSGRY